MSAHDILMSAAGGTSLAANYVEDVFSTYLYTGNGSTRTITNGIDLAGEGGLVWLKKRGVGTGDHHLYDTVRGATNMISSNTTGGTIVRANGLTAFNSNGFSIGAYSEINGNNDSQASWTFRKQPKFFDVVTYTGTGANRTVAHNLGSVPGMIIVKRTDASANWQVYHRSIFNTEYLVLNSAAAVATGATRWNSTTPTSSVFSLGTDTTVNASGGTYVAYLFAHDAGGFGLTGTDNVISCGSYTGTGAAGNTITLGYEPQWLIIKRATGTGDWHMFDTMRMMTADGNNLSLYANLSSAEPLSSGGGVSPLATGFKLNFGGGAYNNSGDTYIYIAIRRAPMKVPTVGTEVFTPVAETGSGSEKTIDHGFPVDVWIAADRDNTSSLVTYKQAWFTRLLGNANGYKTSNADAWGGGWGSSYFNFESNTGIPLVGVFQFLNNPNTPYVYWGFRRAAGFFDEVSYTGTGASMTVAHSLGVIPELMLVKRKSATGDWQAYTGSGTEYLVLNSTAAKVTGNSSRWNGTAPTSSVLSLGTDATVNASGSTYSAYLFASCPGVSKVGSYTGTGSSDQIINCGFTTGARFVMLKRTDGTSSWRVWDTARGIVVGSEPSLDLNSTAAEQTGLNQVDPDPSGFKVKSGDFWNTSGANFIFLAIS